MSTKKTAFVLAVLHFVGVVVQGIGIYWFMIGLPNHMADLSTSHDMMFIRVCGTIWCFVFFVWSGTRFVRYLELYKASK